MKNLSNLSNFITKAVSENSNTTYKQINNLRINKAIEINSLVNEIGSEKLAFILNISLSDKDKIKTEDLTTNNLQILIDFFRK